MCPIQLLPATRIAVASILLFFLAGPAGGARGDGHLSRESGTRWVIGSRSGSWSHESISSAAGT